MLKGHFSRGNTIYLMTVEHETLSMKHETLYIYIYIYIYIYLFPCVDSHLKL